MAKHLFSVLFLLLTAMAAAFGHTYYPASLQQQIGHLRDENLKMALQEVLESYHVRQKNGPDVLVNNCSSIEPNCYRQKSLDYGTARVHLFGELHLEEDASGYFIRDVYCHREVTRAMANVGPGTIPNSNILNCEHTWPQSRFSTRYAKDLQKGDLHHLFPTDNQANSTRGNHEFADVEDGEQLPGCQASRIEHGKRTYFEPPQEHKGNVARALFYFSVRYHLPIAPKEEESLRRWHNEDPADVEEMERHERVYQIQLNRNPFIDHPELVSQISDF